MPRGIETGRKLMIDKSYPTMSDHDLAVEADWYSKGRETLHHITRGLPVLLRRELIKRAPATQNVRQEEKVIEAFIGANK